MNSEISFIGIFYSKYDVPKSRIFEAGQYILQAVFLCLVLKDSFSKISPLNLIINLFLVHPMC